MRKLILAAVMVVLPVSASATAYTFTCSHATMHVGDLVPPLIAQNTAGGVQAGAGSAIFTVAPNCSTTATSSSPVGSYTITANAGTLANPGTDTIAYVNGTLTVIAADNIGAVLTGGITYPSGFTAGPAFPALNVTSNGLANWTCDGTTDNAVNIDRLLRIGRDTPSATITVTGGTAVTATAGTSFTGIGVSSPVEVNGIPNTFTALTSTTGTLGTAVTNAAGLLLSLPWWTVTTSGTSVTATAGTPFTGLTGNITISGVTYTISSINSATSITLTASAGTQTNVDMYTAPSATISDGDRPQTFIIPSGSGCGTSRPITQPGAYYAYYGSGPQASYFYLLPNSPLFQSGTQQFWNPQSIGSNSNFHEYITGVGFRIGAGNAAAIPITTVANNSGSWRNIQVWADDSVCPYALNFNRAYPGPMFWKNVAVYGCANAISSGQGEYSETMEGMTFEGQTSTVIDAHYLKIDMRHVLSDNSTEFLHCYGSTACHATVMQSEILNGSGTGIQADSGSAIFVQGLTSTGYSTVISDSYTGSPVTVTTSPVVQYWSGTAASIFNSNSTADTLHLPVQETPVATDPSPSTWTQLGSTISGWCATITGSASTTVFLPPGVYSGAGSYSCTIPDTVNHIIWGQSKTPTASGYTFAMTLAGTSATPLVIDGCPYEICTVSHTGTRTAVFTDSTISSYTASSGAGNVFVEDDVFGYPSLTTTTFVPGQSIWARQLNIEESAVGVSKITCTGCNLWVLGYKTEQSNPNLTETARAKAEIYGFFQYNNAAPPSGTSSPYYLTDSSLFATGWAKTDVAGRGQPNWINETQSGVLNTYATSSQNVSVMLPMFYSFGATTYPLALSDISPINSNGLAGGLNIDNTYYDTNQIVANHTPFGTNPIHYRMQIQGAQSLGGGAYGYSYSQYAAYTASQYAGGSFNQQRNGSTVATGTITNNTAASTTALTATLSGGTTGSITGFTINTASIPGGAAGTYPLFIYGGGCTGSSGTITINGSATITNATATGGTGCTSVPTVLVPSYFFFSSGTFQPGDSIWADAWPANGTPAASTASDLAYIDWTGAYSNSGTAYGETTDMPSGAISQQALVCDASANASSTCSLTTYFDTGHQNGLNQVNLAGTWNFSFKAKLASGTATGFNWSFGRLGGVTCSGSVTLTSGSWPTAFTPSCTLGTDSVVANAYFSVATTGQQKVEFTDVSVTNATDTDPSGFTAQFITDMNSFHPGSIRSLMSNAQANVVYNATTGQTDILGSDIRGANYGGIGKAQNNIQSPPIQLPMLLYACLNSITNGCDVEYPVPVTTTAAEGTCLADFLWDSTGSTPCGAKRQAEGQSGGWGQAYSAAGHKIRLELGNENWNSGIGGKTNYLSFFTIGGTSIPYAPYCYEVQAFANAFKTEAASLSGYVAGVTKIYWGAQTISQGTGNSSYTYPCIFGSTSPSFSAIITSADGMTQAPYTQYYNVNTWSEPSAGQPTLQNTSALAEIVRNWQSGPIEANAALYLSKTEVMIYEGQNGYTGVGTTTCPTSTELAGWANGEGYATYNGLGFLEDQAIGYAVQHIFTYGQFRQAVTGCSGQYNDIWGVNNTYPGSYRPTFQMQSVMNACIQSVGRGSIRETSTWGSNPSFSFSGYNNIPSNATNQLLSAGLYSAGSNRCLILVNTDANNAYHVTTSGTTAPSLNATSTLFYSANLNDTCETASCSMVTSSTWTNTLPAHSVTAIAYSVGGPPQAATPTFSPIAGIYGPPQTIAIAATTGSVICYNTTGSPATDGASGCTSGTLYTGPVSVATSQTLYAVSGGTSYSDSTVGTAAYTINGPASTPVFSPGSGAYAGSQNVTITAATGPVICYSMSGTPATDGALGCTSGTLYTGPIAVSTSESLYAVAGGSQYQDSTVRFASYTINGAAATPAFSPVGGTYTSIQSVTVTDATAGATIYCTTDGSTPTTSSPVYSTPFVVSVTTQIRCIAAAASYFNSAVGSATYTINLPQAAAPTFTPSAGTYVTAQSVTISSSTPGATICYTTDGTNPASNTPGTCSAGTTYSIPVVVSVSETLNALATVYGYNNSPVSSAVYVIPILVIKEGGNIVHKGNIIIK